MGQGAYGAAGAIAKRGLKMNTDFLRVISASSTDRQALFLATAMRLGTPLQNVEKDFWVTVVLDLLFNGRAAHEPRLLFKGGTSLSKAYGLISRFSEDIDITVFREDIGQPMDVNDLQMLSGKQQRRQLDAIKDACKAYIQGTLLSRLNDQLMNLMMQAGCPPEALPVVLDLDDVDQQTLLVRYPSVMAGGDSYIQPTVKIEAGAKSALDPHRSVTVQPYVFDDMPQSSMQVTGVTTIDPERTFWDKVVILHGLRRWHDARGQLRHQGHRVSRHYYDIYKLLASPVGPQALKNQSLGQDCVRHALMFFNGTDLDLKSAVSGSFTVTPTEAMQVVLKRDYQAMAGMIFGEVPEFSAVVDATKKLQVVLNGVTLS
jgi:hypothetical protein